MLFYSSAKGVTDMGLFESFDVLVYSSSRNSSRKSMVLENWRKSFFCLNKVLKNSFFLFLIFPNLTFVLSWVCPELWTRGMVCSSLKVNFFFHSISKTHTDWFSNQTPWEMFFAQNIILKKQFFIKCFCVKFIFW